MEMSCRCSRDRGKLEWVERIGVTKPQRPTPLADALASYLQKQGLIKRMQQAGIVEEWATLVGPQIAAVTVPESVTADGILRVRVASSAWAQELSLMSPRILARLNDGRKGRVREVRWIVGQPIRRGTGNGEQGTGGGR